MYFMVNWVTAPWGMSFLFMYYTSITIVQSYTGVAICMQSVTTQTSDIFLV